MNENPQPQPAAPQPAQPGQTQQAYVVAPKDKTVAVLLAVFLGFWTWLYTYRKDMNKFWICAGIMAGLFVLAIPSFGVTLFMVPIWSTASWLWAIIDVATKTDDYYQRFNG